MAQIRGVDNTWGEQVYPARKYRVDTQQVIRPADTTAYAANDSVSNSTAAPVNIFFTVARVEGGSGRIVKAQILTSQNTNTAQFRLHLNLNPQAAVNDNAAYPKPFAEQIAVLEFPAMKSSGAGSTAAWATLTGLDIPFVCDSNDTMIYGQLETASAFTPASGQIFVIELTVEQD